MPGSNGNSTAWGGYSGAAGTPGVSPDSTPSGSSSGSFFSSGGSGLISGILSFVSSLIAMQQQNKANTQAAAAQRWYYEDQKKWNSPQNQMYQRSLAGVNPYSDFTIGAVNAPSQPVNMAEGMPELFNQLSNSFNLAASRSLQRLEQKLTMKRLGLEEKKLDLETKRTDKELDVMDANVKHIGANTESIELANTLARLINPYKVSQEQYNSSILATQEIIQNFIKNHQDERFKKEMDKLTSDINYQKAMSSVAEGKLKVAQDQLALAFNEWDVEKISTQFDNQTYTALDDMLKELNDGEQTNSKLFAKTLLLFFRTLISNK